MARGCPTNPLAFIQRCVIQGKILWTYHVNMRLRGRFISRKAIVDSHPAYQVIEEYPEDKYLPSYLVYSEYLGNIFHILFAADEQAENVRIISSHSLSPNPTCRVLL